MNSETKDQKERNNLFNQKIIDSIIDDNEEEFLQLISQININESNINQSFELTDYKMPKLLLGSPSYFSLCCFFGSEKCFQMFLNQIPEGIESVHLTKLDYYGRTSFHFACAGGNLSIIREMHNAGFDINKRDYNGNSPCHFSAMTGSLDAMKYLWSKGADIQLCFNRDFHTPLQTACLYGQLEIVKFIFENVCSIDDFEEQQKELEIEYRYRYFIQPAKNETPLHLACQSGSDAVVDYILKTIKELSKKWLKALDSNSRNPLHVACQNGSLKCVKSIIEIGNVKHELNGRKHVPIIDAAAKGYTDIVLYLLQKGVDINITNSAKMTALDEAIRNEQLSVIKLLIDHGATKDFDDEKIANLFVKACATLNPEIYTFFDDKFCIQYAKYGNMFIGKAVQLESEDLVNYLLEKKCTLDNICSYVNFTTKWKPFMSFLKEKGVTFSGMESESGVPLIVKSIKGGSYDSVKQMIAEGATINKEIIDKYDCILMTCEKGSRKLFNFLLTFNPDMSKADLYLESLLNKYKEYGDRLKETKVKDRLKIAETLLSEYKANPNQIEIICEAASYCAMDVLELFGKYSANFNRCPFDYTEMIKTKHLHVFRFLENHGCFFALAKTGLYAIIHPCPLDRKIGKNDSPLDINLRFIYDSEHDIQTTVFLVRYSSIKNLLSIVIDDGNLIDLFLDKKCFDGILAVYQRVGFPILPKKIDVKPFKQRIISSNNQELIRMLSDLP
ncbi:hypothetical protein M9Y10_032407 [Tritrichomonas musculus]|uniref:DUF3447 domain-containing protein n=1 Tax=Tritrichomonas musculus TaxID=1915356 RepID=A0ABR2GZG9_9EUKA